MCQNPAAINPFPPEQIIGKRLALGVCTQQLLCCKKINSASFHYLREGTCKTEGVRHPRHPTVHTEFFIKPALPVDKLPYQALPTRHVDIPFHPHRAVGDKPPLPHPLFHPQIQIGIILFHLRINLYLAHMS